MPAIVFLLLSQGAGARAWPSRDDLTLRVVRRDSTGHGPRAAAVRAGRPGQGSGEGIAATLPVCQLNEML
jgi:hypothetical protein